MLFQNLSIPRDAQRLAELSGDKVHRSNEVIVLDKNGTHLTGYNQGRGVKHSGQRATKKGYPVMLGGQVSWCPVEETINGKLIFDSALFPPDSLGLLHTRVHIDPVFLSDGICPGQRACGGAGQPQ